MRLCKGRERKEKLPKALFESTAIVQRTAQAQPLRVSAPTLCSPLKATLMQWGGFTPLHWAHLLGFTPLFCFTYFKQSHSPKHQFSLPLTAHCCQRKGLIISVSIFSLASLNLAFFVNCCYSWSSKIVRKMERKQWAVGVKGLLPSLVVFCQENRRLW